MEILHSLEASSQLMELIKADDDVQFFWAIVSVEWEEEESLALLEQNN